jgi:hypothetical protein
MESILCPTCRVRVARRPGLTTCPGCGARLKTKARPAPADDEDDRPRKKKKRKKARSGPSPVLWVALGGGILFAALIAWGVAMVLGNRKPATTDNSSPAGAGGPVVVAGPNGAPGQQFANAGPAWQAKADPPPAPVHPKDDLTIPIRGEPLFASGQAPFVADLVPIIVGTDDPPKLAVYDLRTGEKTATAKAIQQAQSIGGQNPNDPSQPKVALGPDGKTIAAKVTTQTGKGRQRSSSSEVFIYRLGQDAPAARLPVLQWVSWMEFGRDDNQLLIVSAPPTLGCSAFAYDVTKPGQQPMALEVPRGGNRWRNGFRHPDAVAVSPGRNYLAIGEGQSVALIRLSDGKLAGEFPLAGDCVSVAFSADGKELTAHSATPPPRGARGTPTRYHWASFSLADGKPVSMSQVAGGSFPHPLLAAGPKPGLAVHADGKQVVVADTRYGAPVYTAPLHAVACFDKDRLLVYDDAGKQVVVRRIDAEQMDAGVKELARLFGPRPEVVAADRTGIAPAVAPTGWNVPVDPAADPPALVKNHTVDGGADFLMPWRGHSALSALSVLRVETPRDRGALMWNRVDLASGTAEPPIELWPSLLPAGRVPVAGFGGLVADHTADGSKIAVRDEANPGRLDVWDRSGKRLFGFVPYGPETPIEAIAWTADNRLMTRGGGKITGWEFPGPKAVFELIGYVGAYALSPNRKWIALQYEKNLDVFDTATGKPLGRADRANPDGKPWQGFAISRDGTQLAAVELARAAWNGMPGMWQLATWDLRTGKTQDAGRVFAGYSAKGAENPMWLGPRLLLAGGDVVDLDAKVAVATIGLEPPTPLPSPDGRYWGVRSNHSAASGNQRMPTEMIAATKLDDVVATLPRPAAADILLRDGSTIETVGQTGDNGRDAVARSLLGQVLATDGYGTGPSDWKLVVSAERANSTASLERPSGGKIPIPFINGKVQLVGPDGVAVWEAPLTGGFDMNHSKYKTGKEDLGPMGGSITHFNFGLRDPGDAMADEAWDNFMEGLKSHINFPRVLARVNGKVVALPMAVPVKPQ